MTREDAQKAFEEFKTQGKTDEELAAMLYMMFQDEKINLEELEILLDVLGWKLTEEFKALSPEEQKNKGFKDN